MMMPLEQFGLQGYNISHAELIGQGTYARIYKVYSNKLGCHVAVKQIDMDKIRLENQFRSLVTELETHKLIDNPHIVREYDYCIGVKYTYIVLELCDVDLRKVLTKNKNKLPEAQSVEIFLQVIEGLKVFAENSLIHRDLKPQNILCKDNIFKLSDFSFVIRADLLCEQKLEEICGTPLYMAPQLLSGQPYTAKCDIWSLGLMLFEMIYGCTPWPVKCVRNYKQIINKRPLAFPFNVCIGKNTKDFLKKALVASEEKRMSWKQLFEHPLVKDRLGGELVNLVMPSKRVRKVLSTMQRESKRKFINIIQIFNEYKVHKILSYEQFEKLLINLNPSITRYELSIIIEICDKNKDGSISKQEFEQLFCETNFHADTYFQKQIDQIVGIICANQLDLHELFSKFDTSKQGCLTLKNFSELVRSMAPKYSPEIIQHIFDVIDSDHDHKISKAEFTRVIGNGLINQPNYQGLQLQRVARVISNLRGYLTHLRVDPNAAIKLGDINRDHRLNIGEFGKLMDVIKFSIAQEEIAQLFKVIDTDRSGTINLSELENYIY